MLEVIVAVALFSTVATAMTVALNQLSAGATSVRRESMLLRRLQSELAEAANAPRLPSGRTESPRDEWGIAVTREAKPLELKTREGRALGGLYQIRVRADMEIAGGNLIREMETRVIRLEEIQGAATVPPAPGPAPRTPVGRPRRPTGQPVLPDTR